MKNNNRYELVLDVEDYCHDCPAFDPMVISVNQKNIGDCFESDNVVFRRDVGCKHKRKCERMYKHILDNYKQKNNS